MRELRPDTDVIYMSGYSEHSSLRPGDIAETAIFLSKPFTRTLLAHAVAGVAKLSGTEIRRSQLLALHQ